MLLSCVYTNEAVRCTEFLDEAHTGNLMQLRPVYGGRLWKCVKQFMLYNLIYHNYDASPHKAEIQQL